jgi:hypothetical protein
MEKTVHELGYLDALEKLGMAPPADAITKEAQGRVRRALQSVKGFFGRAGRSPGTTRRVTPQAPRTQTPQVQAPATTQRPANPTNRAADTALAEREMAAAARGSAPAATEAAPKTPSFLQRHGGTAALLGAGGAAGAYGMGAFDRYARRPDPYQMPAQYYSAIPGGSPYGGY